MAFLESGKIGLRPVEKEDLQFLRDTRMMDGVEHEMGFRYPSNLQQMEEGWEKSSEKDEHIEFLIEYDGKKAGHLNLTIDKDSGNGDIGLFLHPDFQGEGIGTKAMELAIDYGFNEFPINRIDGSYRKGNTASKKMQEKLGFQKEADKRDFMYWKGEYQNLVTTSILRDEWE